MLPVAVEIEAAATQDVALLRAQEQPPLDHLVPTFTANPDPRHAARMLKPAGISPIALFEFRESSQFSTTLVRSVQRSTERLRRSKL
ncbi:hypothetical protein FA13DRAFT_1730781, partial [Coprinellus micaceus]